MADQHEHVNLSRLDNFERIPIYLLESILRLGPACVLQPVHLSFDLPLRSLYQ